ncbi:alpha/beta hydrolase [Nonomuraea sp. NPDC050547]|uniref:alpha/beta hydrolase n=1 Tax=unclassified Nonomuraea TaxID=2593643 RepID=UPI0037B217E3
MLTFLRRTAGVLAALLASILAVAAAACAFLALAAVTASPPLLYAGAVTACLLTAFLLGRLAVRLPTRGAAAGFALAVTALSAAGAWALVLRPWPVPPAAADPAHVRYWDLPTGSRIAYAHRRGGARPYPVIFLHGGPGTAGEGLPEGAADLAADGFDVYAYDQLGAGRSSRLADVTGYTVARQVADLEAIRGLLGAPKLILVGRSWGATLSAAYLAAHPGRVAKAVFVSPGALWAPAAGEVGEPWKRLTPEQSRRRDDLLGDPRMIALSLLLDNAPAAAHALVPDREADARMRELLLTGKDATTCPGAPPAPVHGNAPGFYANQFTVADTLRVPDPRPRLRQVRVPALILRGTCDYVRPHIAAAYRDTLPAARLVEVAGAGHGISHDQPAAYLRLLRGFLTP